MKEKIKTFTTQNNLSLIIGIFLSILITLAFNRNWINSESNRTALIIGVTTAIFTGISLMQKCRGLFIFVIVLIFLSFSYNLF